jgi:hypothetical protein
MPQPGGADRYNIMINIELLQAVKAAILKNPQHFDMDHWVGHNHCGTTACIAGWARVITLKCETPKAAEDFRASVAENRPAPLSFGTDDLGLSYSEENALCYLASWPDCFSGRYWAAEEKGDYAGMAQAAADRIDHFIATGE